MNTDDLAAMSEGALAWQAGWRGGDRVLALIGLEYREALDDDVAAFVRHLDGMLAPNAVRDTGERHRSDVFYCSAWMERIIGTLREAVERIPVAA